MRNIEFKGKIKGDLDQVSSGKELPEGAVMFREPDTAQKAMATGSLIALPPVAVMILLAVIRLMTTYSVPSGEDKTAFIGSLVPYLVVSAMLLYPSLYIHEYIHAFLFPKELLKQVYVSPDTGTLFVYCEEMVGKIRFVVISLGPAVILGSLPFIVALILAPVMPVQLYIGIMLYSVTMFMSGVGDFLNAYNCLRQVPKEGKVFNRGFHSYWIT